jgi:HlyD family secretion protein
MPLPEVKNPLKSLQTRYRSTLNQFEQELEDRTVSLPATAPWTKRLTQVMLVGIAAGVAWSIVARVDVVVTSTGKLEPMSQSQAVQSKVGGVVTTVLVREGEKVKQGQLLVQLDKTTLYNQLQELLLQRDRLVKEIAVLRIAQQGKPLSTLKQSRAGISPELMAQVQTRLLLVAQLTGDPSSLNAEQRQRYDLFQQQLRDRQAINNLQESGLEARIGETEAQLDQTQYQLQVEQELLSRMRPLAEQGAISRVNLLQRQVAVSELQSQINQNNLQKQQLQIGKLQAKAEAGKVLTETEQDLQRQLAELDARFDTIIKDSQRQLIEVTARLNQVQIDLKNQDLRAPVEGVVFDLQTKLPGMVSQPSQTLLKVVPSESLIAQVQVANADIANVQVGLPVDVRIDAYPFTEYGSIKGVISKVGSEAIALNQQNAASPTVFPVEVRLDRQFLERKSERLALTPGMSLAAMIKVRERAPISYVTEEITKAFDGLKSVR